MLVKYSVNKWQRLIWLHIKGGLVAFLVVVVCGIRPAIVMTESIDKTVFLINNHSQNFTRGNYVWLQTTKPYDKVLYPAIKQIQGKEGDVITISNDYCFVGEQKVGKIAAFTHDGKKLHSIQEGIIPAGKLFLAGTSANSYDSRYLEFGLIEASKVRKAYALF
jgi:type IV secretory pathway protease TraF